MWFCTHKAVNILKVSKLVCFLWVNCTLWKGFPNSVKLPRARNVTLPNTAHHSSTALATKPRFAQPQRTPVWPRLCKLPSSPRAPVSLSTPTGPFWRILPQIFQLLPYQGLTQVPPRPKGQGPASYHMPAVSLSLIIFLFPSVLPEGNH